MAVKMFIDGVNIDVEEKDVQEYKNRGWKTFEEVIAAPFSLSFLFPILS